MKLKTILCFFCFALILSCGNKKENIIQTEGETIRDSMSLHVAVYPCEACLPIYYAKETGIFDSMNVDIHLLKLNAMEDCDTALIHKQAEVVVTDIARLICMRKNGFIATALAQIPTSLALYTAKDKRLTSIKQLKERLIGIERHSESDYYSDILLEGTGIERLDLFRTQFNRHKLRADMLSNGLIEAALLDQPYSAWVEAKGMNCIWKIQPSEASWAVLAISSQIKKTDRRINQINQLIKGYQIAVKNLNARIDTFTTEKILKTYYDITPIDVDTNSSLKPGFKYNVHPLRKVNKETIIKAKEWLIKRIWIKENLNLDSIMTDAFYIK